MSDEVNFSELLCPLLNRRCEQKQCVAFSSWNETYYKASTVKNIEIKSQKDKNSDVLTFNIADIIIDKKTDRGQLRCEQFKKSYNWEKDTPVEKIHEVFYTHNRWPYKLVHNGVTIDTYHADKEEIVFTAGSEKWEIKTNV